MSVYEISTLVLLALTIFGKLCVLLFKRIVELLDDRYKNNRS